MKSLALVLFAVACRAHAGQPLVTDDAAVVAPDTCQLETWMRSLHDGREYWVQPACTVTGNLELDVARARAVPDSGESSSMMQLQAKTVLFASDDKAWSFGMVGGGARDAGAPHGRSAFQTWYGTALASWYPRDDLELDFNLGAANAYGLGTFALAAAAIQYAVVPSVQLMAEAYRDEPGPAKYQLALRWAIIPDRFEAYASYGDQFGGAPPDGRRPSASACSRDASRRDPARAIAARKRQSRERRATARNGGRCLTSRRRERR